MKTFKITLTTKVNKKGETVEQTFTADLRLDNNVAFSEMVEFFESVKNLWKKAMTASKKGSYIDMEVVTATYENWHNPNKPLITKEFNRWTFTGYNDDQDGIYLQADTRYTPAHRDMYLTKDVMKDLAFTLG